jgi:UDP-N-acetylmuramoylalanine--D-glutamate ligase
VVDPAGVGLGGSGLACCHALKAGGADVIAADDSADRASYAAKDRARSRTDSRLGNWRDSDVLARLRLFTRC